MIPQTYKQGTYLQARRYFTFVNPDSGRKVTVKEGAIFWVTTTESTQTSNGFVTVDRKGQGSISHGYRFAPSDMAEAFEVFPC